MGQKHTIARVPVIALALALTAVVMAGCEERSEPDTDLFQLAEEQLRRGDYDEATRNYEAFIERYPGSPLVPIAEQRLRNIDRELEAVMGRRATPAPIYIRPADPVEEDSDLPRREHPWGNSGR